MKTRKSTMFVLLTILIFAISASAQDIHQAVQRGDIETIKALLKKNPELVNAKDRNGIPPLSIAAGYRFLDIVKFLIDNDADVNAKDNSGNTPLLYTIFNRNNAIAEALLSNGADVNFRNNTGISPLLKAVSFGNLDLAEFLLNSGAEIDVKGEEGSQMLESAVNSGFIRLIDHLLEKGIKINVKSTEGNAFLHAAAQCGHNGLVNLLIDEGADVRSLNKKGGTLLHSAAIGDMTELMKLMINKGTDVNARNKFSLTPLHKASYMGNKEAIELLIENRAEINIKSNDGTTPFHFASEEGHKEIVELLVTKGADNSPKKFPVLTGKYFGQKPPGMTPEIFTPGIISNDHSQDFAGTFSPDGAEFFFTRRKTGPDQRNWYTKIKNGVWTEPQLAPFTYDAFEFEPHISPDGKKLFYGSRRPKPDSSELNNSSDIWFVEKTETGWSEPQYLTPVINDVMPMYMSAALDGTLYYTNNSDRGICKSELVNDEYTAPERLPDEINYLPAAHPYIAPDESFLIFDARPTNDVMDDPDIFISFHNPDGSWTKAVTIEDQVSSGNNELAASVSPDGKYLFFESNRIGSMNIYWVDAKIIDILKAKIVK